MLSSDINKTLLRMGNTSFIENLHLCCEVYTVDFRIHRSSSEIDLGRGILLNAKCRLWHFNTLIYNIEG